ncbi:MBL fold metallo-hydrolase [Salinimicrobium xinjiangense]|uniref:MBL fold metallo-hydrolase n=1 Tax=Salinimicrobium xinjiangense TaxID=438596 RepID=UPI000400A1AC|nr:MBL fold metallo-hydrolase [Salinimicrobium xinjiangense]
MIEFNTEGIAPTAASIRDLHTGKFREVLPGILMIKGAKNPRGFDQGYGILKGKDLVLIDIVEEAYKEAVEYLLHNGFNIKAILITGKGVTKDAYADFESLSKDAGDADIYVHPDITPQDYETKALNRRDELLSKFDLEPHVVPGKEGQVVLYCSKHNGIVFTGDSALGSDYGTDELLFTRGREQKGKEAFPVEEFWQGFSKDFDYFFPRQGKPAIEVDVRTRTSLLDRLARGEAGLE